MRLTFFHPCIPPTATAQMRRHTISGRTYQPASVTRAAAMLRAIFEKHRPECPTSGPVAVAISYTWPKTDRLLALNQALPVAVPKATRPDVDNLAKLALDAATIAGWWKDDNCVADLRVSKFYGDIPGIAVTVEEIR